MSGVEVRWSRESYNRYCRLSPSHRERGIVVEELRALAQDPDRGTRMMFSLLFEPALYYYEIKRFSLIYMIERDVYVTDIFVDSIRVAE